MLARQRHRTDYLQLIIAAAPSIASVSSNLFKLNSHGKQDLNIGPDNEQGCQAAV